MHRFKLFSLLVLLCLVPFLTGCTVLTLDAQVGASGPDLRLLTMPAYEEEAADTLITPKESHLRVDLWLDASQVMGGINPNEKSLYPHLSRKYCEGGFHYRYQQETGWYESVLRAMLTASDGSLVRVLRSGNERLPDHFLTQNLLIGTSSADQLRSLRRDLLTYAISPMPSLFSEFSDEDMTDSFYALGTPRLNQMARFSTDNGAMLENSGIVSQMSAALDQQIAAFASGEPGELSAFGDDQASPLLYAIENLDLSRLSVITCDPAALRRLSGVNIDGSAARYIEQALAERGIFDQGLSVGLYAFTLDYAGQMISFGAADFSEPLVWGRLDYNSKTKRTTGMLPMPRTLLTLVVGSPAHVSGFTSRLNQSLDTDSVFRELRGPQDGELTYFGNGQTVTQQPFSFSYSYTAIQRPVVACYTQNTSGLELAITSGEGSVDASEGLSTISLSLDHKENRALELTLPVEALPEGVNADLSALQNAHVEVVTSLLLSGTKPNTADMQPESDGQSVVLRDTVYLFTRQDAPFSNNPDGNPFTLRTLGVNGQTLRAVIDVDHSKLLPGYYRLRVCADLYGDQLSWEPVSWIDRLSATITNEQIVEWESFTELMTTYDRNTQLIPKQFQHAWGPLSERGYHGAVIPDFPPVMLAPGLSELFSQLRSAANVEQSPYVRCVFDVFVNGSV